MRTEPPFPLTSALARLRPSAGRARRWLAARGTISRVALLLITLGALGGVGYLAMLDDPSELTWAWIYEGRHLSIDDIHKISDALDAASIPHVTNPSGQIGVKPSRRAEALSVLAKVKAVPPSLGDLSNDADAGNPFDGPEERDRRDNFRLERILKAEIEGLDSAIASALVRINRIKKRGGYGAPWDVSSVVYLQTEGGRKLGHRVVEGIETFLTGAVPGLKPEAITVADQTGHKYLAAGNPSLKEQMLTHAREETWRDQIAEELQYIPGVGVAVLLETAPAPPPVEVPPSTAIEVARPNGKIGIEPEPSIVVPASNLPTTRTRANVWVRIPRTFYLLAFQAQSPGRQPSPVDLEPIRQSTEKLVREAVEIHVPRDELGVVKVGVIQDDLASSQSLMRPLAVEPHRPWALLALSSAITLTSVAAIAGLVRLAASRRPSARPARSAWRPGYVADGPSGPVPGPSERVRELIRLNPEAAAGVLQRWIGQGGALE